MRDCRLERDHIHLQCRIAINPLRTERVVCLIEPKSAHDTPMQAETTHRGHELEPLPSPRHQNQPTTLS